MRRDSQHYNWMGGEGGGEVAAAVVHGVGQYRTVA